MYRFKKILSLLMAVVMMMAVVPLGTIAEFVETVPTREVYSGTCGTNLTWTLNTSTGVLSISGTGSMTDYSGSSNAPWYSYRTSIKTVNIGSSVTSIGVRAFYYCSSLTKVTMGSGVKSIGSYAFVSCRSLTSITIGSGVTSICSSAFNGCRSLTSVTIPASVTTIGSGAFYGCTSLTGIGVVSGNQSFRSLDGVLFNYDCTELICCPGGKPDAYEIPYGVISIGSDAFSYCTLLTSVTIPESVTSIGNYAFSTCLSLVSVTIPGSVASIGGSTFSNCSSLTSVTIPNSVTNIGNYAFSFCSSLTSVTIPGNVTSIGNYAFYACHSLCSATFLGVPPTSFGSDVFNSCADDFTIYYTEALASEWAPNGETTWNGYPIQCINLSETYTVKFYDGIVLVGTQTVNHGDYAVMPNEGALLPSLGTKWTPNPGGRGEPWFTKENNYKGQRVYSDLSLYKKYRFDNEIQGFWFKNESQYFFRLGDLLKPKREKLIKKDAMHLIEQNINSSIENWLSLKWNGSCFGMCAVIALTYSGKLDPEYFQKGATCINDFQEPLNNKTLLSLLEYYNAMQLNDAMKSVLSYDRQDESKNCRYLVARLKVSKYPVVFKIGYATDPDKLSYHAMLAYDLKEVGIEDGADSPYYLISFYDPTNPYANWKIKIDAVTYEKIGFDNYGNDTINGSCTAEEIEANIPNLQAYLCGLGKEHAYKNAEKIDTDEDDGADTILNTDFDDFTIECSNGDYAVIEDGCRIDGSLDIRVIDGGNDLGFELSIDFAVPALGDGETYTITPAECISIVTGEPLEYYSVTLRHTGELCFISRAEAAGNIPVTIKSDGSITTLSDTAIEQTASVTTDDLTGKWFWVDCYAEETTGLSMVPGTKSASIVTDDGASFDITVWSYYNELLFEDINGGAEGVTVIEDEDLNTVIIYNDNGEVAASELFGHSLIFCTMGANDIETQSGISMGGTAVQPEDPIRAGMIFGGWYTTYECEEGTEWSFETPITEDTFIYAKWIVDDDYTHLVTFHIEGYDDVGYLVLDGEALTEYELPEIPEIEGYVGSWPEVDLSCVTNDIIVEAIYIPIPLGDANGDGVIAFADVAALYGMIFSGGAFTPEQQYVCDVNGDGTVSFADVAALYNYVFTGETA